MASKAASTALESRADEAMDAALAVLYAGMTEPALGDGAPGDGHPGDGRCPDPLAAVADGCLDVLVAIARSEAKLAAAKAVAVATYAESVRAAAPPETPVQAQEMAVAAEIGCVLAIGDRAGAVLLADSCTLARNLPRTLTALRAGTLSWRHAKVMIDETSTLTPAAAVLLEAHFLDPEDPHRAKGCPIGEMPAYRFRHKARIWRERHHPDSIEKRHSKGFDDRCLDLTSEPDGMARLSAYLSADAATAIWNRLTATARGLQGPAEARTLTQLRVDLFAAAILRTGSPAPAANPGGASAAGLADVPAPKADVLVTVPVFALLGLTDEPAMLDGYGPIPPSMARDLVAGGASSFYRVLTDPRDGAPLEIGRTNYRLTKPMRSWLRLRDGKCPFPGCSNHSLDNEADHILSWHHGGTTGITNLGSPCPKHHRLKHASAWKPTPATPTEPPGWIAPSGRTYLSEHQDWEAPQWPAPPLRERKAEPGN